MAPNLKHNMVTTDLIQRIQDGEWKVGEKFPSVDELTPTYPYSRCTVLKGVQELINRGYLTVRRGVGTFVARDRLTGKIGLIVNDYIAYPFLNPFPYLIMARLTDVVERYGYIVKRYVEKGGEDGGYSDLGELADDLKHQKMLALISVHGNFPFRAGQWSVWKRNRVPMISVDFWGNTDHEVNLDRDEMYRMALNFLKTCGQHQVALVGKMVSHEFGEMAGGFGLETRPSWVITPQKARQPEEEGFNIMKFLWNQNERPNGLFVDDDIVAKGVAQAVGQLQIRVPDELRIIHHANSDTRLFYPVPTSRLEFDLTEIASKTGEMLVDILNSQVSEPKVVLIKPKLVI